MSGPSSLEAILEEHKIQPNIRWIPIRQNDLPCCKEAIVLVLFDDGTVIVESGGFVDWLGAVAYSYVSYTP